METFQINFNRSDGCKARREILQTSFGHPLHNKMRLTSVKNFRTSNKALPYNNLNNNPRINILTTYKHIFLSVLILFVTPGILKGRNIKHPTDYLLRNVKVPNSLSSKICHEIQREDFKHYTTLILMFNLQQICNIKLFIIEAQL